MAKQLNRNEQSLQVEGLTIDYFETGTGKPIIIFRSANELTDPLLTKLAQSHHIIAVSPSGPDSETANQLGEGLNRALTRLRIEPRNVIGISGGARSALAIAIAAPQSVERLILLSPLTPSHGAGSPDLAAVEAATLVLVGTGDTQEAIATGRLCRERIPSCHLSFVYGAGHEVARERPEACLNPIIEFLEQGEQFIIFRESQVIRP
jgi:pimeloyl-ACP methyl ester carboxylesterase